MNKTLSMAVITAIAATAASGVANAQAVAGYSSGDFHNHTACSDGSTSVKTLVQESLANLDWFIHVGHSGAGPRDCRFDDFSGTNEGGDYEDGDGAKSEPGAWWQDTIGFDGIKGDLELTTGRGCDASPGNGDDVPAGQCQEMWRWQSLQEFNLEQIIEERDAAGKPAFLGLEWVVPGHEHASNSIVTGQYDETPVSDAIAQFEYCFARNSDDTSQGGGQGWTCEISEEANNALIARFGGDPDQGVADYNSTLVGGINTDDAGEHVKSVAGMYWMQENFPGQSISVSAHTERQGAFIPDDDEGFNVEHLRDWNEAAPSISYGMESQPGHQAQTNRGSYNAGRPTVGLWTWGGTGCYAAAEAARPGLDFDGVALTQADFAADGRFPEIDDDEDPAKVTLCRSGIRTAWDAMLSEGRRFWFFGSSDWHDAGMFSPFEDNKSTNDFIPGAYQKNIYFARPRNPDNPAQDVLDSLRLGNGYVTQGDIIDRLQFQACNGNQCATMGGTLRVPAGTDVTINIILRDPRGTNQSSYSFNNPSLLQIGVEQPMNQPEVAHVDLIAGVVSGKIDPLTDPSGYTNPLAPETTRIERTWLRDELAGRGQWKRAQYVMNVTEDSYVRLRGSNIPPGTPNERDMDGNPLEDALSDNIACADPACPPHIEGILDFDAEAWADVWFYANPIFIEVD